LRVEGRGLRVWGHGSTVEAVEFRMGRRVKQATDRAFFAVMNIPGSKCVQLRELYQFRCRKLASAR
jgi:hypothetical protein